MLSKSVNFVTMITDIIIEDYNYDLPDSRIAKYPLEERDSSKLLVYKDKSVEESKFSILADFIPENSLMVFNNTKVVPARLFFRRDTGAHIEISVWNLMTLRNITLISQLLRPAPGSVS